MVTESLLVGSRRRAGLGSRFAACLVSGASVALVGGGCGAEPVDTFAEAAPADEALADGLTLVEMDEADGKLVLEFREGERSISLDLRLGAPMLTPPTAEELAENPDLPSYEVDAQISDGAGRPFHQRMAGDHFIDPGWSEPQVEDFDLAGRLQDIQLMRHAVPALRALPLPAGLEQLRLAAIDIGSGVEATPEKPDMPAVDGEDAAPGALRLKQTVVQGPSSVSQWDFIVRKKSVSIFGISLAEHSAVHLRGWSGSSVVFNSESCNHGTCAMSSAMRTHCVMPGFRPDDGTHSRFFYVDGCTTPYAWNSGPGHHNCNDDTELQGRAIWHDTSVSTTGGSCGAAGAHYLAPGCTY